MKIAVFPNPFDWFSGQLRGWNQIQELIFQDWIAFLNQVSQRADRLSPRDIALDRINQMQVLLYRGYVRRQHLKKLSSHEREMQRFAQWMHRHSENFRRLIDLYPEWLAQFNDPAFPRARLLRTIAFHLYQ